MLTFNEIRLIQIIVISHNWTVTWTSTTNSNRNSFLVGGLVRNLTRLLLEIQITLVMCPLEKNAAFLIICCYLFAFFSFLFGLILK